MLTDTERVQPPAVLHHRAAHWDSQAGRELRLPDLGGHAVLHPRGHCHSHHEQRLPGVLFLQEEDTGYTRPALRSPGRPSTLRPLRS